MEGGGWRPPCLPGGRDRDFQGLSSFGAPVVEIFGEGLFSACSSAKVCPSSSQLGPEGRLGGRDLAFCCPCPALGWVPETGEELPLRFQVLQKNCSSPLSLCLLLCA